MNKILSDYDPIKEEDIIDDEVLLDKMKFTLGQAISKEMVLEMKHNEKIFRTYIDFFTEDMLVSLESYVWVEKLQTESTVRKFPKTVWQHFKQNHFPLWLLKYFPVKYNEIIVKFERNAVYPKFKYFSNEDCIIQENIRLEKL